MATLTSEAEEKYPLFETWLSRDFVHVVNNPRIMKAFWKWSHFTGPSWARNICFLPGTPPAIGLFDGCAYNSDGTPKGCHYGMTWSARMIGIHTALLDLFVDRSKKNTGNPFVPGVNLRLRNFKEAEEVVQCTILHEMVHWSYKFYGNDDEAESYGGDDEHGTKAFELEAYGHHPTLPLNVICKSKTPYLGVHTTDPIPTYSETKFYFTFKLKVNEVVPNSPADKAGIKPGDEILEFADEPILGRAPWLHKKPGDPVTITIRRSSTIIKLNLIIGTPPVDK